MPNEPEDQWPLNATPVRVPGTPGMNPDGTYTDNMGTVWGPGDPVPIGQEVRAGQPVPTGRVTHHPDGSYTDANGNHWRNVRVVTRMNPTPIRDVPVATMPREQLEQIFRPDPFDEFNDPVPLNRRGGKLKKKEVPPKVGLEEHFL